jgi:2-methylcitrate dehydratase PrpD
MRVERMDTIEDRLISFAEALRFRDIDPAVLRAFKQRFIDAIGCALGAFGAEPVSMARKIASRVQSSPGATVIGTREKSSIELAGFANTAMIRCLDLNDDYFGKDGPTPVIPSAQFWRRRNRSEPMGKLSSRVPSSPMRRFVDWRTRWACAISAGTT